MRKFRADPEVRWNSDMMDAVEPEPATKKKEQIDASELAAAKARAGRETAEPRPTNHL